MALDKEASVRITGLNEFRLALKEVEGKFDTQLGRLHKQVAQVVADKARSKAASQGGVAAKAANSIKAGGGQARASITYGGEPWSMGAEFGAAFYKQFKPWRGSDSAAGYFVYPTIREEREEVIALYQRELEVLMKKAFPS